MARSASAIGLSMVLHTWASPRHLLVVLAAVLALGACSASPNPNLYTIAPVNGAERGNAPKLISLRQVVVARYLERSQIVRSSDGYRLDVMANDWWGEPLGSMLDRILVQELSQRLPQSTVFSESSAIATSPDATVEVTIQRLDRNSEGAVVLQAQLGVSMRRRAAPVLRNFRTQVALPTPDTSGQVAASSTAVGQLADGIALMLSQGVAGK
jgi:uncharacterized protein